MSVPAVGELHQLYAAADEGAIAALLAKLAVEKSYVAKLDETRQVRPRGSLAQVVDRHCFRILKSVQSSAVVTTSFHLLVLRLAAPIRSYTLSQDQGCCLDG